MPEKKILIVDDDRNIRSVLTRFFASKGYEAVNASSGTLGLNLLSRQRFDALVSDIKMPNMTGTEFAAKAHKLAPPLVIILLTGYGSLETAQEGIRAGIHDYLTKPVDLEKLLGTVEDGIKGSKEKGLAEKNYIEFANEIKKEKEKLDSMQEDLISLVSHEIRTPLTLITGGLGLLKDLEKISGGKETSIDDGKKHAIFKSVEKGSAWIVRMIDDATKYMDLIKGGSRLNRGRIDLKGLISDNAAALEHLASSKGAGLTVDLPEGGIEVYADGEHILDILFRLVDNSIQHNRDKVEVGIELKPPRTDGEGPDNGSVKIVVSDNGDGISDEAMNKMFKPFNVGAVMSHQKGLGLSLAFGKRIMELHGGDMEVENSDGKGAKVALLIPGNSIKNV